MTQSVSAVAALSSITSLKLALLPLLQGRYPSNVRLPGPTTNTINSDATLRTKENEKPSASVGDSIVTVTHLDSPPRRSESGYELSPVTTTDVPHNWNHTRYQVSIFEFLVLILRTKVVFVKQGLPLLHEQAHPNVTCC